MANCGCNTKTDLTDKTKVDCIKQNCSENTELTSLLLITKSLSDKFAEFNIVFDDFQQAVVNLCQTENQRFELIKEYVIDISDKNSECCENINSKLREIVDLVDAIEIGEVVHPTTTSESTTTINVTTTTEITTTILPTTTELLTTTIEHTTTIPPTTTILPTTTLEATTTESPTTTELPMTTSEPTTTMVVPEDSVDITCVTSYNALTYQTTPTYDGSGQAVHPDIYYNPYGWNGYKYWMAMTPYPNGNDIYENPSILVSNDGDTWIVPVGLTNPLDTLVSGHNSDTSIFMGHDNKLWIIFRWTDNTTDRIYAMSSDDGIVWSAKTEILTFTVATEQCLSPDIVVEDIGYSLYYIDWVTTNGQLKVKTCSTVTGVWSASTLCSITGMPVSKYAWHIDVVRYGNEYHALIPITTSAANNFNLNFATSSNGIDWTIKSTSIITPSVSGWDNNYIYKATSVLMFDGIDYYYDCWYSALSTTNVWHIGRTIIDLGCENTTTTLVPTTTEEPTTTSAPTTTLAPTTTIVATTTPEVTTTIESTTTELPTTTSETATTEEVTTTLLPTTTSASTLLNDLVSVWEMDEISGTNTEDSHGTFDGTINGVSVNQAGKIGTSFGFNGTSNYITMGDVLDFNYNQPFSISVWYYNVASSIRVLVSKLNHASPYNGYTVLFNAYRIQFMLVSTWGSNYLIVDSAANYSAAGWHHLVVTYDGTATPAGVKMYMDGSNIGTTTVANSLSGSTLTAIPFMLGTRNNNAYFWSGRMDQTSIWGKVLTSGEVTSLYNSGNGLAYTSW